MSTDSTRDIITIKKLCTESKYFEGMLSGNFVESKKQTIELHEIELDEFQALAKWLNSTQNYFKTISRKAVVQLLFLSDRFIADRLYSECMDDIRRRLKLSKGFFPSIYLEVAVELSHTELKEVIHDWFIHTVLEYSKELNMKAVENSDERACKFRASKEHNRLYGSLSNEAYSYLDTWITEVCENSDSEWRKLMDRMWEIIDEFKIMGDQDHRELEEFMDLSMEVEKILGTTPMPSRISLKRQLIAKYITGREQE